MQPNSLKPPKTLKPNKLQYIPEHVLSTPFLKSLYLNKVHVTGIPTESKYPGTNKQVLHWVLTLECAKTPPRPPTPPQAQPVAAAASQATGRDHKKVEVKTDRKVQIQNQSQAQAQVPTPAPTPTAAQTQVRPKIKDKDQKSKQPVTNKQPPVFLRIDESIAEDDLDLYNAYPDRVPATIIVKKKEDAHSKRALGSAKITMSVYQTITVDEYLTMLKEKGRHRFLRNKKGYGCLYFIQHLIADMGEARIVRTNSLGYGYVVNLKEGPMDKYYVPAGKGSFF